MLWSELIGILRVVWTHLLDLSGSIVGFLSQTFELDGVTYSYLSVIFGVGFTAYLGYVIFKWFVPV